MARTKKEFNKTGAFQIRFKKKFYESELTQEALANILGVSRPTVFGWLEGKNLPDILSLEKIARYFEVSSDYLLGLSNIESPDVSVRAAAEYTGLTEDALMRLNNGLFDPARNRGGLCERKKKADLQTASALIQSDQFQKIIENLTEVVRDACMEKIMTDLIDRYFKTAAHVVNSKFCYASDDEREFVISNLSCVLKMLGTRSDRNILKKVPKMDDKEITIHVYGTLTRVTQANELHQFHATKALNSYIDQMVSEGRIQAEQVIIEK